MSALSAVLAAAAVGGCGGGDGDGAGDGGGTGASDPLVHVHGLGVDPRDGVLYVATHTGLFRIADAGTGTERVGDGRQDTMGFTIAGPGRFLASGHPGPSDDAVNPLGLIRSTDGGETWTPVSLQGEADFHVLRAAGDRVYGVDSGSGSLLVSADGGESWDERPTPGPPIDLALGPADSRPLLAASPDGLHVSGDDGRSWRPLGGPVGLLAWPREDRLYLVDAGGTVHLSDDRGGSWARRGTIGGQPAALTGHGAGELHAALADGTIKRSSDGGASWDTLAGPQ